jgi:uracil-DNA glycosylase
MRLIMKVTTHPGKKVSLLGRSEGAGTRMRSNQQDPAIELAPQLQTIDELREAASSCKNCDLWKRATQVVFGEGLREATVMFVGEQPGDQEDRAGHPFVGPAGRILDQALVEAGIDRAEVYVTNAVKHFKWDPAQRGKRRIHKKPRYSEIHACHPWLEAEIRVVKPEVIVCLGATASQALLGKNFSVMRQRGELVQSPLARYVTATVHPSSILRAPDDESRHAQMRGFVNDLKMIRRLALKKAA